MARHSFCRLACGWLLTATLALALSPVRLAQAEEVQTAAAGQVANPQRGSGLPLPRFVSLRSGRVNSRIGPGLGYPVDWLYLKPGLPMEIIQEYDNWRRVRDPDGAEGWINQALLSGKRTAIAAPWQRGKDVRVSLLAKPQPEAAAIAFVEPGAVGSIEACDGDWCKMTFRDPDSGTYAGFVQQSLVWGAYPGELIED
ncbi:MAG TPA: SH3 domain-containing protein [Mesorhizobium sp.]|jgi:SH3-like domain-containing protein|nr:SH3 domain-containing protein [Mesorhizobium sp.]